MIEKKRDCFNGNDQAPHQQRNSLPAQAPHVVPTPCLLPGDEERVAALGRLAQGIAQEIRNPLTSVKMNLSILRSRLAPEGADAEHFTIAQEEVDRLGEIIDRLTDYATPGPPNLSPGDIHDSIEGALREAEAVAREKGILLVTDFCSDLPLVCIDHLKTQRAVTNVILNAIEASRPGGQVRVSSEKVEGTPPMAVVTVQDQGEGIAPDQQTYLFDPFYTTRKRAAGMGLAIAARLISLQGGGVSLKSSQGEGTTLSLSFSLG